MVDEALSFTDSHAIPFDAVSVSCGPGSYTGLRIGVSMAKGICYGRDLKLIAVPTLELLCVPVLLRHPDMEENALLCPMLDARRMEVYAGLYDRALHTVRAVGADVVDGETYRQWLDERPVYFFGNGAKKCMDIIHHPNAHYLDGIEPEARWMQPLAERRLLNGQTEDVAYFEPFYLKDYVAKVSKDLLHSK
jgi:tRNA threonylcarbamoyladenosine biosynthesis protein TsaB